VRTPFLDVWRPAVRGLARLYLGLRLEGTQHIPGVGPVVIVPNHQTYADPVLITIPVRRPIYYMAWSQLFDVPGLSWMIRRLRAFPVEIEARDPRATREAVRLLQAGEAVMIFPEGSRSLDGSIGRFKPGAFRLAVSVGAPILPVTIEGGHAAWPPGRRLPRRGKLTITYHPLVYPDGAREPRDRARELAERTRAVIVGPR
jgi:1-acyl-sn-glycerol-3-phosphate acyltransferase